jgi:hypothetical protein
MLVAVAFARGPEKLAVLKRHEDHQFRAGILDDTEVRPHRDKVKAVMPTWLAIRTCLTRRCPLHLSQRLYLRCVIYTAPAAS